MAVQHQHRLLTRSTPTLDVDITDRDACIAVLRYVAERFDAAGAMLCRIGNPPKFAVPFQTSAPFRKIVGEVISP